MSVYALAHPPLRSGSGQRITTLPIPLLFTPAPFPCSLTLVPFPCSLTPSHSFPFSLTSCVESSPKHLSNVKGRASSVPLDRRDSVVSLVTSITVESFISNSRRLSGRHLTATRTLLASSAIGDTQYPRGPPSELGVASFVTPPRSLGASRLGASRQWVLGVGVGLVRVSVGILKGKGKIARWKMVKSGQVHSQVYLVISLQRGGAVVGAAARLSHLDGRGAGSVRRRAG